MPNEAGQGLRAPSCELCRSAAGWMWERHEQAELDDWEGDSWGMFYEIAAP